MLGKSGTAPADFTLHDDQHAFRVAERMVDLIGEDHLDPLSPFEIALLLLAAYLHDIGLTPERGLVSSIRTYLLTGEQGNLTEEETRTLTRWLDQNGKGRSAPLLNELPNVEALSLSAQLTTAYCREMHADWSVVWIATSLDGATMGSYSGWLADLQALCLSHNQGRSALLEPALEPRLVAAGSVVNLRYLACVLRVADVLEVDPERTPAVIFRQRTVATDSAIYWHKDHEIALTFKDHRILLVARPTSAVMHRAVLDTADQIDAELALCRDLADRGSFASCPGFGPLEHVWSAPAMCFRDVQPYASAYEYIEGDFRPDTMRILDLLGGTSLYRSPLAALRELLQNASDAIAEQIAWTRLQWDDPKDMARLAATQALNRIDLSFVERDGEHWLDCTDTGVGMTKEIITSQLLVSGSAHAGGVLELKRRCAEAGFPFHRTGRFGVGVLSYFMIADEIRIRTQRASETGVLEGTAWTFVSEGLDAFGELCRVEPAAHGTTCSLRLRRSLLGERPQDWIDLAMRYLRATLVSVPCTVRVSAPNETWQIAPGWVRSTGEWTDLHGPLSASSRGAAYAPPDLSDREFTLWMSSDEEEERSWALIKPRMGWKEDSGALPDGLGEYRVMVPVFELPDGPSLVYMQVQEQDGRLRLEGFRSGDLTSDAWAPTGQFRLAWNGMTVYLDEPEDADPEPGFPGLVEVNFQGDLGGEISVSRNEMVPSAAGIQAIGFAWARAGELHAELVTEWHDSPYRTLNEQYAGGGKRTVADARWAVGTADGIFWQAIAPPSVSALHHGLEHDRGSVQIDGATATVAATLRMHRPHGRSVIGYWPAGAGPDRLVAGRDRTELIALWSDRRDGEPRHPLGTSATFPPCLKGVIGYRAYLRDHGRFIWNREHPVLQACSADALAWLEEHLPRRHDPLDLAREILGDRARAAAFVCDWVRYRTRVTQELKDRDPTFLPAVIGLAGGAAQAPGAAVPRILVLQGASFFMRDTQGSVSVFDGNAETTVAIESFDDLVDVGIEPDFEGWQID